MSLAMSLGVRWITTRMSQPRCQTRGNVDSDVAALATKDNNGRLPRVHPGVWVNGPEW